jgi:hypothetical protein
MTDREHTKWVRVNVVDPTIAKWGRHAWDMFALPMREELITAACMRIVLGWARSPGNVENSDILRLCREAVRQIQPEE